MNHGVAISRQRCNASLLRVEALSAESKDERGKFDEGARGARFSTIVINWQLRESIRRRRVRRAGAVALCCYVTNEIVARIPRSNAPRGKFVL